MGKNNKQQPLKQETGQKVSKIEESTIKFWLFDKSCW